jgi:hypothetical protein
MTTEEIIIAIVRVLTALPVLVWPFPGAIIAILGDLSDLFLKDLLHLGGVSNYQRFDKWLDQVYMLTFLVVALRWAPVPRNIAVGLFAYRLVGFAVFAVTGERGLLILFPNVFEYWFLFVAGVQFFGLEDGVSNTRPRFWGMFPYRYTAGQIAAVMAVAVGAKLVHEYILHVGRWFDGFTATEAVEWFWEQATGWM